MKKLTIIFLTVFIVSLGFSYKVIAQSSTKKKYEILLNLCRAIADKGCFLKNYSFLYDLSDKNEKKEIVKKATQITKRLNPYEFSRIDFTAFKRNLIYIIARLSKYRLTKDKKILDDILEEADSIGIYKETANYVNKNFNTKIPLSPKQEPLNINSADNKISTNINIPKSKFSTTGINILARNFDSKNIGILFLIPLSGKIKSIGEKCLEGILTASDFFHSKNRFKFYFIDTNKFKKNMTNSIIELCNKHRNIAIIIGPIERSIENMAISAARVVNIPIISMVAGENRNFGYRYYFNHSLNLEDEIEQLSNLIKRESYFTGVLYPESSFGLKLKSYFLESYGSENSLFIPYEKEKVDFKKEIFLLGELEKVKNNEYVQKRDIDSLFIADDVDKALLLIPQLFFYDMKDLKIYGTSLWNNKNIFKLDKKYQNSITYLGLINYDSKNGKFLLYKNYLKEYFNDSPDFYSTIFYDTVTIVDYIDFTNNDTVKDSILNKKFYLLTGETKFDSDGNAHKRFKIFKIMNGKLIIY